jgi:hypothetical protein
MLDEKSVGEGREIRCVEEIHTFTLVDKFYEGGALGPASFFLLLCQCD